MEDLPKLSVTAQPNLAARTAILFAALLVSSCSHSTGGTATPQHGSAARPAGPTTSHTQPTAPPSSVAASDEDEARQTVNAFNDAYNTQNWAAYTELMCAPMRAQFTGVVMDYVKRNRATGGPNTIKSMTVTITGDTATATITGANEALGPGTIKLPLKREDGWKVCQIYHP